jgi:hypothetical protein
LVGLGMCSKMLSSGMRRREKSEDTWCCSIGERSLYLRAVVGLGSEGGEGEPLPTAAAPRDAPPLPFLGTCTLPSTHSTASSSSVVTMKSLRQGKQEEGSSGEWDSGRELARAAWLTWSSRRGQSHGLQQGRRQAWCAQACRWCAASPARCCRVMCRNGGAPAAARRQARCLSESAYVPTILRHAGGGSGRALQRNQHTGATAESCACFAAVLGLTRMLSNL